MKKEKLYYILIIFIVYLVFKKSMDIIVDFKYPVYNPPPTGIWKYLVEIRDILSAFTFLFCVVLLILLSGYSNYYLHVIIISYLLYDISYFFIDKGYIWYLINKNDKTEKVVNFIDIYLNSFVNLLLGLYCFYAIVFIFFS